MSATAELKRRFGDLSVTFRPVAVVCAFAGLRISEALVSADTVPECDSEEARLEVRKTDWIRVGHLDVVTERWMGFHFTWKFRHHSSNPTSEAESDRQRH